VHLEHEGHVGTGTLDGPPVVVGAGAVRGAHVDQPGTRLLHHLGNAEAAADLDALAPRHDNLAAPGQRRQRQEHGGGVVVDDNRRLGAAQPGQQAAHMGVAGAPPAGGEVELEVGVARPPIQPERGAPEIRVEQHS